MVITFRQSHYLRTAGLLSDLIMKKLPFGEAFSCPESIIY